MKVKKIKTGAYRVYSVWTNRDQCEVRYAKKDDAQVFQMHRGGYLGWEDFNNREDAQAYLDEKQGAIWW